jgi:hypothetical protein
MTPWDRAKSLFEETAKPSLVIVWIDIEKSHTVQFLSTFEEPESKSRGTPQWLRDITAACVPGSLACSTTPRAASLRGGADDKATCIGLNMSPMD